MAALSSFYPYVLPYVSGAPEPLIDQRLILAARELCEARVWVVKADAVEGDGTTRQRSFVLPADTELVRVTRCTVGGRPMHILNSSLAPADYLEANPQDLLTDSIVVLLDDDEYLLYPIPASGDDIVIWMALTPTLGATTIDDSLYARCADVIGHGAVAMLCEMLDKPWTNPDQAARSRTKFEDGMNLDANRVLRQGRMRTKASPL